MGGPEADLSSAQLASATPDPVADPPPVRRRTPAPLVWLVAVVAAWLVPVAAHAAHADLVLLPLLWLAVAGVQRGGTLLDRLVLAGVQLFGAACAAGLLFSVWPWGLHPVPVAGVGFTAVLAVAALTGRRPRWSSRFPVRDRLVVVAALGVSAIVAVPFLRYGLGGRLGILMPGEDFSRHFVFVDVIGRLGGYPFLADEAQTRPYYPDELSQGMRNYPQGVHLVFAVTDRFLRSATGNADGVTAMNTLIWLYVAAFAAMAGAVLWSVRRLAGPGVGVSRLLPVLALVAAWLGFGDTVALFLRGFPNQLVALGLVAVLTALVCRPLPGYGDQLATIAVLLVGISFSYHLYLPFAVAMVAVWAVRVRLWRRLWAYPVAVVVLGLAAVTPGLNLYATTERQLTAAGTAVPADRPATVLLLALAVTGLLWRGGMRSPARRTAAVALGLAGGAALVLAAYQIAVIGRPIYYFEKTLHMLIVVALVALGALARVLPRRLLSGAVVVAPVLAVLAAAGGAWHTTPGSTGLRLFAGVERGSPNGGADAVRMTNRYPDGGGAVNVDLSGTPYRNWFATYYGSAMQSQYRYGHRWYLWLHPTTPKTVAELERMVVESPLPVRFFIDDPTASMFSAEPGTPTNVAVAERLRQRFPDRVEVISRA